MTTRENTRKMKIGNIEIGGGNRIAIQSMCNTRTTDVEATVKQIEGLVSAGCDIVRLAVPDLDAADCFGEIKKRVVCPLVADIHFDYKIALRCAELGADKIRINPGNIGGKEKVMAVASACRERNIPIRIGVNMGSINKDTEARLGRTAAAMIESAAENIHMLNECNFDNIAVSLKASDVPMTIEAYRLFAKRWDYPLHVGVTEAGTAYSGLIKSSVGIGTLLNDGIGDTIRVSLTAPPIEEIRAAKGILKACGLLSGGIEFVSCPSCGRCRINQVEIANKVEQALMGIDLPIKVAVMGCVVNGPGEAKDADIGVAGGDGCAVLFKKGEIIRKIKEEEIVEVLLSEIGAGI